MGFNMYASFPNNIYSALSPLLEKRPFEYKIRVLFINYVTDQYNRQIRDYIYTRSLVASISQYQLLT